MRRLVRLIIVEFADQLIAGISQNLEIRYCDIKRLHYQFRSFDTIFSGCHRIRCGNAKHCLQVRDNCSEPSRIAPPKVEQLPRVGQCCSRILGLNGCDSRLDSCRRPINRLDLLKYWLPTEQCGTQRRKAWVGLADDQDGFGPPLLPEFRVLPEGDNDRRQGSAHSADRCHRLQNTDVCQRVRSIAPAPTSHESKYRCGHGHAYPKAGQPPIIELDLAHASLRVGLGLARRSYLTQTGVSAC